MFHRIFLILMTVLVTCSCATEVVASGPEVEEIDEPWLIQSEYLSWCSPQVFEKQLDKKTPLPAVRFRKIHNTAKDIYVEPVSVEPVSAESTAISSVAVPDVEEEQSSDVIILPAEAAPVANHEPVNVITVIEETQEHDAEPEPEEAVASVREDYLYKCEGEGWLLESVTDPEGGSDDNLRFKGREYIGGYTVFSFYPFRTGIYLINLRMSDYSTGEILRKVIKLEVNQKQAAEKQAAEKQAAEKQAALPAAADEALVDEAAADEIEPEAVLTVHELLSVSDILNAANALEAAGDCDGAVELLSEGIQRAETAELDTLYFKLGGLFERCPSIRDERAAVELYKKIVDYYPVSNYWIEAKERIKYLERNYIFIR